MVRLKGQRNSTSRPAREKACRPPDSGKWMFAPRLSKVSRLDDVEGVSTSISTP